MREMLFRGKRKYNGEWVYGYYAKYRNILNGVYTAILQYDECEGDVYSDGIVAVIPETVGQYTGLTDNNDKKIFEGDIIRTNDNKIGVIRRGIYDVYSRYVLGGYYCVDKTSARLDWISWHCEVVGNKWDNPELLEAEE